MASETGTAPCLKLLLDEMLDPSIAAELRARGQRVLADRSYPALIFTDDRSWPRDVVAVAERPDLRTQPDRAILAAAEAEDRIVVTEDRDYRRLGAERVLADRSYPALICSQNNSVKRITEIADGRPQLAARQSADAWPPRERARRAAHLGRCRRGRALACPAGLRAARAPLLRCQTVSRDTRWRLDLDDLAATRSPTIQARTSLATGTGLSMVRGGGRLVLRLREGPPDQGAQLRRLALLLGFTNLLRAEPQLA